MGHSSRAPRPSFWRVALQDRVVQITTALSILGATATLVGQLYFMANRKPDHFEYAGQLEALDKAKTSIQSLGTFIDQQKKQLQLSQTAIDALKDEEKRLHPLVDADRKVIDAMFAVQEQRNQAAQSRERWIGFGFGVLASLIASVLYAFISVAVKRRRPLQDSPTITASRSS